jgi:hypothetical protein
VELEGTNFEQKKDSLRGRGVSTLNQWCKLNGYEGVTKECIQSAMNQDNPRLNKMAKTHLLRGVAKDE